MEFNKQFYHLIDEAFTEDVGEGDHSSLSCIPKNARGKAILKIKQDGILAGVEVAEKILRKELGNKEAQEAHIKGLVDEVKMN